MAAIAITRGRFVDLPGCKVFRGLGTWSTTDTEGTLAVPSGIVVGFVGVAAQASVTAVSYAVNQAMGTNGTIYVAPNGTLAIERSAGTDSGGTFFFAVEYESK